MNSVKSWVFRNYWWIAIAASICVLLTWALVLWRLNESAEKYWQVPLAAMGGIFSFAFFVQRQRLDELKLFRDLFTDFNDAYDELNDHLERIATHGQIAGPEDRQKVVDYFNLCAEEFWWYREGYIPNSVWGFWCRGMMYYFDRAEFQKLWNDEQKINSYYGLTLAVITRGANLKE
jgi:hypothetical protein